MIKMNRPIRVLFALNDASGGASMSAYQLMKNLSPTKVEPFAVCYPSGSDVDYNRFERVCTDIQKIYMPWCTIPLDEPHYMQWIIWAKRMGHSLFHLIPIARLSALIRKWDIDIVHSNTCTQWDAAFAAQLMGIPHVWHLREFIGPGLPFRYGIPTQALGHIFSKFSNQLVSNSSVAAANVGLEKSQKMTILPNPVELDAFDSDTARERGQELRRSLGIAEHEILIGKCAAIGASWKRHDLFIRAAAELKDYPGLRFCIFGTLPESGKAGWAYYQKLCRMVQDAGLGRKFCFAGYIPDIPGMMNALDILCHTSPHESFGRIVIEAMAAAKPVVGFQSGGVGENILHGKTGFLAQPESYRQIANFLKQLVGNPSLCRKFGRMGKVIAEKGYSMVNYSAQMESIYHQLMNSNPEERGRRL